MWYSKEIYIHDMNGNVQCGNIHCFVGGLKPRQSRVMLHAIVAIKTEKLMIFDAIFGLNSTYV